MSAISENTLPKPPIPELSVTAERFLEGIKAYVSSPQYKAAQNFMEKFQKSGGEGEKLQNFLKEYAAKTENYVSGIWLDDMYLKNPLPLPINSNPYFLLPKQQFKNDEDRFGYIARYIIFSLMFKQKLDNGELKQEFSGGQAKGAPLSMATYQHFFSAYRRPGMNKDSQIFSQGSRHIIVACNNQFFMLLIPGKIAIPSERALQDKLMKIEKDSKLDSKSQPIGIFTTENRREWARIREKLIQNQTNKKSIELIENCLFVVCMDESIEGLRKETGSKRFSDARLENMAHHILHGNKSTHSSANRWFDKFLQFIVTKDGTNGICIEHSVSEGITVLRFCEEFLDFNKKSQPIRQPEDLLTIKKLNWEIDGSLSQDLKRASEKMDRLVDDLDMNIMKFTEYGKGLAKKQRISPDVFIQLSLQLTYFRLNKRLTSTYESAGLRKFRLGRIDNIRASSQEALDFAKSFFEGSLSKAQKWEKFLQAVRKQTEILTYTINGEGPDNHLLCLKEMASIKGLPEPAIFQADYYKEYLNFRLSTSQLPTVYDVVVGYGPVVPDGYGCSYNPEESKITFCISSFKSNGATNSEHFAENVKISLLDLKELCETSAAAPPSPPMQDTVTAEAK